MGKTKTLSGATETAQNEQENLTANSPSEDFKAESGQKSGAEQAKDTSTYTVDEFARASETVFDEPYSPDIVRAAFFFAGITTATKEEAKKLVEEFAHKEVSGT